MRVLRFAGLVALVSLATTQKAAAEPDRPPPGPDLLRLAQQVGLSDQQVNQIKRISFAANRALIGLEAKLKVARLDLHEAMESDTPPAEGKVMALIDRIGKLETELKKNRVLMMLRVRKTMGLQQWRKLQLAQARRRRPPQPPAPPRPPHGP
jgi:hypothetical protein